MRGIRTLIIFMFITAVCNTRLPGQTVNGMPDKEQLTIALEYFSSGKYQTRLQNYTFFLIYANNLRRKCKKKKDFLNFRQESSIFINIRLFSNSNHLPLFTASTTCRRALGFPG